MNELRMTVGAIERYECAGGCGAPVRVLGAMCPDCAPFVQYADEEEIRTRILAAYAQHEARLAAESSAAAACGDPARRSELLARLPRVQAGIREMRRRPRWELWRSDVPLGVVSALLAWDALRWLGCAAKDGLGRLLRPTLRDVTGFLLGAALGVAASALAWRLR